MPANFMHLRKYTTLRKSQALILTSYIIKRYRKGSHVIGNRNLPEKKKVINFNSFIFDRHNSCIYKINFHTTALLKEVISKNKFPTNSTVNKMHYFTFIYLFILKVGVISFRLKPEVNDLSGFVH